MSSITVSVDFQPDPDYKFTIECAGEGVSLTYEQGMHDKDIIYFGSIAEMESVAKIMLSTAKVWKEGFLSN